MPESITLEEASRTLDSHANCGGTLPPHCNGYSDCHGADGWEDRDWVAPKRHAYGTTGLGEGKEASNCSWGRSASRWLCAGEAHSCGSNKDARRNFNERSCSTTTKGCFTCGKEGRIARDCRRGAKSPGITSMAAASTAAASTRALPRTGKEVLQLWPERGHRN